LAWGAFRYCALKVRKWYYDYYEWGKVVVAEQYRAERAADKEEVRLWEGG
jgi:hypothetical protein